MAWTLDTAVYSGKYLSVAVQDSQPYHFAFGKGGDKLYVVGIAGSEFNEYDLSSKWDISSATFLAVKDISSAITSSTSGVCFNEAGTALFIVGYGADVVSKYQIGTAWDITSFVTTASETHSVAAQSTAPTDLCFSPSGDKFYITDSSGKTVYQYNLSTPWVISSGVTYSGSKSLSSELTTTSPIGAKLSADGTKLIVLGGNARTYQYTLSTAWDISTAAYDSVYFDVWATTGASVTAFNFSSDGTKMYVVEESLDRIWQFTLEETPVEYSITLEETLALTDLCSVADAVYLLQLSAALSTLAAASGQPTYPLLCELVVSSGATGQPTRSLGEILLMAGVPTTTLELSATLGESLALEARLAMISGLLAQDGFALSAATTADITRLAILAEALSVSTGVGSTLEITTRLAEYLIASEAASIARRLTASDTLTLADSLSSEIEALLTASSTLALSGAIDSSFVLIANESLAMGDTLANTLEILLRAEGTLAFIGRLPLEGGDYQAWVMNADTTGTTSYSNFPMDALATHAGVPYGINATGLYRLEGDTDDGEPIEAVLATGDLDFSTSRNKNIPRAYLYLTQAGPMILKTISSIRGSRQETYYELAQRTSDGDDDLSYRRVPLARGVRGEWWRFEIHNVDGADFDFDGAEVLPVVLSRRG